MRASRIALAFGIFVALFFLVTRARAETWEAPVGGRALALPDGKVVCPGGAGAWTLDVDARTVKPPTGDDAIGKVSALHLAADADKCAAPATASTIDLVALGPTPEVDPASVSLSVDDARVELRGRLLKGATVQWRAADRSGSDVCVQPTTQSGVDTCVASVGRGLPADPSAQNLSVYPAGVRLASDAVIFDANGQRVLASSFAVRPAVVLVASLTPPDVTIDLSGGNAARIPLTHPEAVTSADCGAASCEVVNDAVIVRGLSTLAGALTVRLHLVPRVLYQHGDAAPDPSPGINVPILPCGMSVASGDAVRGVDDSRVVVKIDSRCAGDVANFRFFAQGRAAEALDTVQSGGAAFVLLRVGRVEGDDLSITASRGEGVVAVIGAARTKTRPVPIPHAVLELPGKGTIDFIPTNRSGLVRFGNPGGDGQLFLLPIEGVYDVSRKGLATTIQGEPTSAGFVALHFGYRVGTLPGRLANDDLAVLVDPVERPMHEANVPSPLGASSLTPHPLAELDCEDASGKVVEIKPGTATNIPFTARDSCRVVLHAERLAPEDGVQLLNLSIDVTRVDGSPRPDAHVSEPITLRAAPHVRLAWVKGVLGSFDRISVRLSHSADESHYAGGGDLVNGAPAVQWSVLTGTGHARLYATTSIPTGLYRVSDADHSGILSLNFGLIARLTWLDTEGHEGFLGLEGGVMGVGLANDVSAIGGHSLTQVATVTGVGLSVPIANRSLATETSINLHAWFEYEVSRAVGGEPGSPFGFVFGPSISIGNVGTNL